MNAKKTHTKKARSSSGGGGGGGNNNDRSREKKLYSVKYLYKTHLVDRRNSYSREQSGETRQIDNESSMYERDGE